MADKEGNSQLVVEDVKTLDNEPENVAANSYDQVFGDEPEKEPEAANTEETPEKDTDQEETTEPLEEATESKEEDSEEDDETTKEGSEDEIVEEVNLKESLKGIFNNDYIDLLESIDNPDLQSKLIDAGKLQRADLDRKRLDLGESNKLVNTLEEEIKTNGLHYNRQQFPDLMRNFIRFDALFTKDPKQAMSILAKQANIDLTQHNNSPIEDDLEDDYRLPEEIARDDKLTMLEKELTQLKNRKQQDDNLSVQQELDAFANAKDDKGNLKYPLFGKIRINMGQLFNDNNPDMTMDKAYKEVVSDLYSDRDTDVLRKSEIERKAQVEKAKRLKRQSIHSTKVDSHISDPRAKTLAAVDAFLTG